MTRVVTATLQLPPPSNIPSTPSTLIPYTSLSPTPPHTLFHTPHTPAHFPTSPPHPNTLPHISPHLPHTPTHFFQHFPTPLSPHPNTLSHTSPQQFLTPIFTSPLTSPHTPTHFPTASTFTLIYSPTPPPALSHTPTPPSLPPHPNTLFSTLIHFSYFRELCCNCSTRHAVDCLMRNFASVNGKS